MWWPPPVTVIASNPERRTPANERGDTYVMVFGSVRADQMSCSQTSTALLHVCTPTPTLTQCMTHTSLQQSCETCLRSYAHSHSMKGTHNAHPRWLSCEMRVRQYQNAQPCHVDPLTNDSWHEWAASPSDFISFLKAVNRPGVCVCVCVCMRACMSQARC